MKDLRSDFSCLKDDYIYLDTAATSQTPDSVISGISKIYNSMVGNAHSKMNAPANLASTVIEDTRKKVAEYIGAKPTEIAFTKSATESLNIAISSSIRNFLESDENVVITALEHHANLVPYQEAIYDKFGRCFSGNENCNNINNVNNSKEEIVSKYLRYAGLNDDFLFDYDDFEKKVDENTKIIGITASSNVTGEDIDFERINNIIAKKCKERPIVIVDATQLVPHKKIDVEKIGATYLAFSAHKMYGPFGVGVLYVMEDMVEKTDPLLYGGDMIEYVYDNTSTYLKDIHKFEAGTQNPADIYGLNVAISYIEEIGMGNIEKHLKELTKYAYDKLSNIAGVNIYSKNSTSIISFTLEGIHAHDVASILDAKGIAIRAGHHCAMPLHDRICEISTNRVSFGIYNTKEDVDVLVTNLQEIIAMFKG